MELFSNLQNPFLLFGILILSTLVSVIWKGISRCFNRKGTKEGTIMDIINSNVETEIHKAIDRAIRSIIEDYFHNMSSNNETESIGSVEVSPSTNVQVERKEDNNVRK